MLIIHLIKLEVLMLRALFFLNQVRKIPSSATYIILYVAERDSHFNSDILERNCGHVL